MTINAMMWPGCEDSHFRGQVALPQEPLKQWEVSLKPPQTEDTGFCTIRSGPYTKPYAVTTWIGSLADNKKPFLKAVCEKCMFMLILI